MEKHSTGSGVSRRRPYEPPKVTVYGDIRDLTRSASTGVNRIDTTGGTNNRNST